MLRASCLSLILALLALGCGRQQPAEKPVDVGSGAILAPPPHEVSRRSAEDSLAAGVAYLLKQQSADGAWRSDRYATFKDGLALTPLVVGALQEAAAAGVEPAGSAEARRKGLEFLAKLVKPDGSIDPGPDGIDYPVYTAALTIKALAHADGMEFRPAQRAWIGFLKARQLTGSLGWKPEDKQYGGWGYCRVIPGKPEPNSFAPPLIESNLSATIFALDALAAAGELDADSKKAAAIFVRRCQNWSLAKSGDAAKVLDGGFHFIYDDPVRNKAGVASQQGPDEMQGFNSYGSTTADGLRALVLCGLPDDAERIRAAENWLSRNFRADTHSGKYAQGRESNREAVYFYYAASVAKLIGDQRIGHEEGWSRSLIAELVKRQEADGSWANPVELVRENEPLVATSNAIAALARCKKSR